MPNRSKRLPLAILPALTVAALVLMTAPTLAALHIVNQTDLSFSPADITVHVGDVVRWVWSAGTHTVTNGASLADPALGTLFDAPLTSTATTFEYTFNSVGDVPYLCRPHATFGMTGIVRVQAPTGVEETPQLQPTLLQNAPNPFNPSTRIAFDLPAGAGAQTVALRVFDMRGRLVRTLIEGALPAGPHAVAWDGTDDGGRRLASGAYAYRLETSGVTIVRRMMLVE